MSRLSELAYLNEVAANQQLAAWGFESRNIAVGTMAAQVTWNDNVTVVAFRGTDVSELADWIVNIKFFWLSLSQGKVHRGWYAAFKTLEPGILAAMPKSGDRRRQVWITGHSLGGALAVVCGHVLREKGIDVDAIVTFGQPMVADQQMASFLGTKNTNRYVRLVNDDDVVPKIPPSVARWDYSHFGKMAWFHDDAVDIRGRAFQAMQRGPLMSDQAFPPGKRPLTPTEFERLKRELIERRNQINEKQGAIGAAQFSDAEGFMAMLADHGIDRYVEKVRFEMIRARVPASKQ